MVTEKGFYLDIDGLYKDIEDNEEIETQELDHSEYGHVKYLVYNGTTHAVCWTHNEGISELPEDWVEGIE